MSNYDRKNYFVTIAALVISIFSVGLAYYAIRASWEIAEVSGSLDKSGIEVGIGAKPLERAKENFVVVGGMEVAGKIPVVGVIPFTFHSSGKRTLENLLLSFQYHDLFKRESLEVGKSEVAGAFAGAELKKTTSTEANRFFVSYSVPSLNPGVSLKVAEPLYLTATQLKGTVPVKLKDGSSVELPYEATYAKNFGLAVSAKDTAVAGYSLSVAVEAAGSLNALSRGKQVQSHISERRRSLRKELGVVKYLAALLTSSPTEDVILVFVPLVKVDSGDLYVYGPTKSQEVASMTFSLLTWAEIF